MKTRNLPFVGLILALSLMAVVLFTSRLAASSPISTGEPLPATVNQPAAVDATYSISGKVTDMEGNPVSGVTVRALSCDLSKQPVLLIHGWGIPMGDRLENDATGLAPLYKSMELDGYQKDCNLFYVTSVSQFNSREANIQNIRNFIRNTYTKYSATNPNWRGHFDIIGHSYGGLYARFYVESKYYFQDRSYGDYGIHIDNVFTLGSPHGGVIIPAEMYPGAHVITGARTWEFLTQKHKIENFLSSTRLFARTMEDYNFLHNQPKDVCYRLIAGRFLQQDNVPLAIRAFYLPYALNPGDMGVSIRSALVLKDLWFRSSYPHVVATQTSDMHGFFDKAGLTNLRSYVYPGNTYNTHIRNFIGTPISGCVGGMRWQQIERLSQEEPTVEAILIKEGAFDPGETITGTFSVDWDSEGAYYVAWQGGDLLFTLQDAEGRAITPDSAASDSNIEYDRHADDTGGIAAYMINDTVPGLWTYSLTSLSVTDVITYNVYANADTLLVAKAYAPEWHPYGAPVVLTATVTAAGTPVPGASLTTTIIKPDGTEVVGVMKDDGQSPDATAGDGIYSQLFTSTNQGGYYFVLVEVEGIHDGREFQRTTEAVFAIGSQKAVLSAAHADRPVDEDGDGQLDFLEIDAGITVAEAGNFALRATLLDPDGIEIETQSAFVEDTAAGNRIISLRFSGQAIFDSGRNGPYKVADILLFDNDTLLQLDVNQTGWSTAAYDHMDFGPAEPEQAAALSRTYADRAVDADADGRKDSLELEAGIVVTTAGTFSLSATLSKNGTVIDTASATAALAAGSRTMTLQFKGDSIYGSGLNGPYTVSDIVLTDGAGMELDSDTDWSTAAYDHRDFGPLDPGETDFILALPVVMGDQAGRAAGGWPRQATAGIYETTTGPNGAYTFNELPAGGYVVVAGQANRSFAPASHNVVLPPNATGIDFTREGAGTPVDKILVPAGEFQMGCDKFNSSTSCTNFNNYEGNNIPLHTVYLDAYYIDKYEVTNARYGYCVADAKCYEPLPKSSKTRSSYYGNPEYDDYPVIYVTWYDAQNFCEWAGGRLPTEAEWEKAARGDKDKRKYPWGMEEPDCDRANYRHSSASNGRCIGDTSRVGDYPTGASAVGALDMGGNVREWVHDWAADYYSESPYANPQGPESGSQRIIRGGGWDSYVSNSAFYGDIQAATRNFGPPQGRVYTLGIRCAYPVGN